MPAVTADCCYENATLHTEQTQFLDVLFKVGLLQFVLFLDGS